MKKAETVWIGGARCEHCGPIEPRRIGARWPIMLDLPLARMRWLHFGCGGLCLLTQVERPADCLCEEIHPDDCPCLVCEAHDYVNRGGSEDRVEGMR